MTGAAADCLVYALGGGTGHAVRGALLARALERRGTSTAVWVHEGRAALARALHDRVIACPAPGSPADLRASLDGWMQCLGATRLVVDTFVEGIAGELADGLPPAHATALLRLRRDGRRSQIVRALAHYARVIDIEPNMPWLDATAERVGPVARALEGARPGPDVLLAAGDGELRALLARLGRRLAAAGLDVRTREHDGVALLEGQALGARVVVGAAGYNLTYELARAGVWHLAVPLRRRFDDQHARGARVARMVGGPEALERAVVAIVRGGGERARAVDVVSHDDLAEAVTR